MSLRDNLILKRLITLLTIFILGYLGLIIIHNTFAGILNKLDVNVKNEHARYKVGEYIIKEITSIESNYYKMALVTKIKALKPIEEKIKSEIEDIRKAITVLKDGGFIEKHINLNLIGVNVINDKIYFSNTHKDDYTFEAIDLLPKLNELTDKFIEMEEIMKIRFSIIREPNKDISDEDIFKVNLFFKQLPTLFVRMKENASRLLYDSKTNIEKLEQNILEQKTYYIMLEYIFTFIAMLFVLVFGYLLTKQILKESKKLEEISQKAIEAEQEALRANETKSQFLANMSHEIRTPLNAIIGFSNILSKAQLEKTYKDQALIITRSASALLNIINDILDISKIESGKSEISKNKFSLSNLLEQVVQLYSINTKQKNIRFLYTLDKDIPNLLINDETKIKQVLSNILSNAIKFTPNNKTIYFNVTLKKIKKNIATINFSIKDEGIGISKEEQKNIFMPFSQADGSITRKFGGTGLGLSISLNIVKMLGSEIKLKSVKNEGSTFSFDLDSEIQDINSSENINSNYHFAICGVINDTENIRNHLLSTVKYFGKIYETDEDIEDCKRIDLIFCFGDIEFKDKLTRRKKYFDCPVVFVGNKKKIENYPELIELMDFYLDVPIYGSKIFNIIAQVKSIEESHLIENEVIDNSKYQGKILVAEDNTNNQLLIKLILEEFGLDVTIVENGQIAVEKAKNEKFDLIFLDINMPIMDGLEALKLIKENESYLDINTPIIALTANSIKGDKEKYIDYGMDNYLSKPIKNHELSKILNKYLNNQNNNDDSMSNEECLDINKIVSKLDVSKNIAQMVINRFKSNIIEDLEDMKKIIKEKDTYEISQKAHYLKNSCLNVGLDDICKMLEQLENDGIKISIKEEIFKTIDDDIRKLIQQ